MEVMEAIRTRRSVRKYSKPAPSRRRKLQQVLEAGRISPSASNAQNWRFIVVRGQGEAVKARGGGGRSAFCRRGALRPLVVCGKARHIMDCGQPTDTVDCSIALSYMMLEAHALGLGNLLARALLRPIRSKRRSASRRM